MPKKKPRYPHMVCKPCWELKYCPYGPLVEFFPLIHGEFDEEELKKIRKSYSSWMAAIAEGGLETEEEIYEAVEKALCLRPQNWEWISQYRTDELSCSVFGHICPVFFTAEGFTETREERRTARTIPREVMLKVVRRDGHVCCICGKNVRDDEVEFDHIIPHSRGGPTSAENLRVVCRSCNRKKKDSLSELIDPNPLGLGSQSKDP